MFGQAKWNTSSSSGPDSPASKRNKMISRKTSAEIVREAKSILASNGGTNPATQSKNDSLTKPTGNHASHLLNYMGARLVSTRRPITPREPRRQLYGRVAAPPGRPPSAFSLRYLQFESRALPNLEPIPQATQSLDDDTGQIMYRGQFQRSESSGSILDCQSTDFIRPNGKLPALLMPPKIAASLDNLSEEMPPRKDFKQPRDAVKEAGEKQENSLVKDHPLKKTQAKSHDGKVTLPDAAAAADQKKVDLTKKTAKDNPKAIKMNRNNDLLAQSSTETLLDMLKAHAGIKECNEETVQHINGILSELYSRVKGARGGWRGAVLGTLYGLVECVCPKVLLSVARVVLALRVTGSNLTGACKLIFKVARNEVNDALFIECDVAELLVEGLGRASPLDEPEACIYGYGAVRFLANSSPPPAAGKEGKKESRSKSLAYRLAHHGAVQLMVLHLQILNEAGTREQLTGAPLHALFQLSSALRALAGSPIVVQAINSHKNAVFLTTPTSNKIPQIKESLEGYDIQLELAGPPLVKAAEICHGETETQYNIIRTLSALSEIDKCCEVLADSAARLAVLLGPFNEENEMPEKPLGCVSRLGYILGNIVGKYDTARINIFNNDVAMEYLIDALFYYANQKYSTQNHAGDTVVDVIVKLVRVVANMGVNSEVGKGLVRRNGLGTILLSLLRGVLNILVNKDDVDVEELLLATLGALHNLSFYHDLSQNDGEELNKISGTVNDRISDLSSALVKILSFGTIAAQAEAARVLGNMTRSLAAREAVCSAGGMKILTKNLESEDFELVASSCGVLVNILGDWERRASFRELKGPLLLRDVLQRSALQEDWLLAGIVCQALWNYLIDTANVIGALGEDEADYIAADLSEYLDKEKIGDAAECDELWEQFSSVASDLLDRIQSSISITNSPCLSADGDEVDVVGEIGDAWGGRFKEWLEQ